MLPRWAPIECFQVFGTGVYCYMLWTRAMKRVFLLAFLFSLANLVQNGTGNQHTDGFSIFTSFTVGNMPRLDASYGVSELLVFGVLVYGMFAAFRLVRTTASEMRARQLGPPQAAWASGKGPCSVAGRALLLDRSR